MNDLKVKTIRGKEIHVHKMLSGDELGVEIYDSYGNHEASAVIGFESILKLDEVIHKITGEFKRNNPKYVVKSNGDEYYVQNRYTGVTVATIKKPFQNGKKIIEMVCRRMNDEAVN